MSGVLLGLPGVAGGIPADAAGIAALVFSAGVAARAADGSAGADLPPEFDGGGRGQRKLDLPVRLSCAQPAGKTPLPGDPFR